MEPREDDFPKWYSDLVVWYPDYFSFNWRKVSLLNPTLSSYLSITQFTTLGTCHQFNMKTRNPTVYHRYYVILKLNIQHSLTSSYALLLFLKYRFLRNEKNEKKNNKNI